MYCPVTQQHTVRQAVVLAGGRGKRLASLTDNMPKPLLPIEDRPFLQLLLESLRDAGIRDIVVCAGYLAAMMQDVLGDGRQWGVRLRYAVETTPLGTGGAVRHALPFLPDATAPFWVCNGDTLLDVPWQALAREVFAAGVWAGMITRQVAEAARYGAVQMDARRKVTIFAEKSVAGKGHINAGVYLFTTSVQYCLPDGAGSLEQHTLPLLAAQGQLIGVPTEGFFLDIGTPETYAQAQHLLPPHTWRTQRRAVLLDRDGTLIVEKPYLHTPEDVELLPTVVEGMRLLQEEGFFLVLLTNQSGIGRGYYSPQDMDATHVKLCALLAQQDVILDGLYHCSHHPQSVCSCRKPEPGMAYAAANELGFSLDRSYIIGNNACDVQLGLRIGSRSVLVRTGHGIHLCSVLAAQAHYVAKTFFDAAKWIRDSWRAGGPQL